jgi:two-component system, chemotaxis family, sensor kinase CheA
VDAIKTELTSIEATSRESGTAYDDLVARQKEAATAVTSKASPTKEPQPVVAAVVPDPGTNETEPSEPVAVTRQQVQIDGSGAPSAKGASLADSTIRVDVGQLDKLMNLVGELVLARNQILQFTAHNEDGGLNATSQRLNLITTELQEGVMKTRMQPIGMVWSKLPRVVRDLAAACHKQIGLEMDGAETELDKTIIEAIKDPGPVDRDAAREPTGG